MRLEPVDPRQLGWLARQLVRFVNFVTRRMFGKDLKPQLVAAHHPKLLFGRSLFESALLASHRVDARLKILGSLRAAMIVGCPH
jgi:3',5'-cyclic AMP phosphodiesterase CpdA